MTTTCHRATPGSDAAPAPAPADRPTAPVTTADRSAAGMVRRPAFDRLPEPAALVAYGTSAGDARAPTVGPAGRHGRLPHPGPPVLARGRPPDRGGTQEQSHRGVVRRSNN
ncbi:hypothetical protein ACFU6I_19350 [Streptomyces sp. NPDC057486]|uniref:hypothetical protein n=1 Tax=Streptomyces sp. NPDC057486 TaxID=3346145 RepID=UPI0036802E14